jgi:KTSC domain
MRRFPPIAFLILLLAAIALHAESVGIVSRIKRVPVESSALAAVGYSKKLRALEIEFRNGSVYRYLEVPLDVYDALRKAQSKARFYDENIRHKYRSQHVKPRTE